MSWYLNLPGFTRQLLHIIRINVLCFNLSVCASKYSGGSVMYYPDFHAVRNPAAAEKFENEFV